MHWIAGVTALFFCFAIVFYARKLNADIEERFKLQVERDELLELTDAAQREARAREPRPRPPRGDAQHLGGRARASAPAGSRRCSSTRRCPSSSATPAAASSPATAPPSASSACTTSCSSGARSPRCWPGPTPSPRRSPAYASPRTSRWSSRRHGGGMHCTASFTPLPERPGSSAGFGVILTGVTVQA